MVERRRPNRAEARGTNAVSPTYNGGQRSTLPRRTRRKATSFNGKLSLGVWSSRALLMGVAAVYSTNFASVKYLETLCLKPPCNHDPSEVTFCRFMVSACVCLPVIYANRKHVQVIIAGLECGFWMTVNYICQAEALEYIPAGKCAFIAALAVAVVPLFSGFFLGKPIKPMSLVSAMVALMGVAVLENMIPIGVATAASAPSVHAGTIFFGMGKGDILALGQPLGFGYAVMRIKHYIEKYSHVPNCVLTLTASQCVAVCVLSFIWLLYDGGGHLPDLSYMLETHRLVALGWTGIVTTVVAIVLQGIALQKASATDASLIFSTEPIWGSLFARWLLNESLTNTTYIGGSFILAACVLGSLTDSSDVSPTERRRQQYKSKSSDLSDTDSLLPTTRPIISSHGESVAETSIASLTDVKEFPTSISGSNYSNGKIDAFI